MNNKFKNGSWVIVSGPGEDTGRIYKNQPAQVIRRDPYYKDYLVRFKRSGKEEWIKPKYLRKPYTRKKRRS